ncbi:MAG: penicillin-binding protein 2 [Actinobacteria bacterium]|nr:penicillin-binding protein 2 [Actinomycetota bacterium]
MERRARTSRRSLARRRSAESRRVRFQFRLATPYFVVIGLVLVLVARLLWVGVFESDVFAEKGLAKRERTVVLKEMRGTIYDRNGEALVMTVPTKLIAADPTMISNPVGVAEAVSLTLGLDRVAVENALTKPDTRYSLIARQVDAEAINRLQGLIAQMRSEVDAIADETAKNAALEAVKDYQALIYDEDYARVPTNGSLARSVTGRMDRYAENAMSGIELLYDEQLRATDGIERVEKGVGGITIPGSERVVRQARAGSDVTLTLDRSLQYFVEDALARQVAAVNAKGGTVIVGRPQTGEVLAMANVARNEAGEVVQGTLNQALRLYEPGSVMKIVPIAAAYDQGIMTTESTLHVPDSITLYDKTINDSHRHAAMDMTTKRILAESSNVGTIKIAQAVAEHGGREMIVDYLHRFGFGEYTGVGLPKEQSGIVKPAAEWNGSDIGSIPIGQSVTVTPLQMWGAYNVIANDGVFVEPKVVRSVIDAEGKRTALDNAGSRRVTSAAAANMVTAGLKDVIEDGTGNDFKIEGLDIAAKTGTAYKVQNGTYGTAATRKYSASFAGFFPADDPEITIMVMIDEPGRGQHFGATAAGPVFQEIAREAMRRFAIATDDATQPAKLVRAQAATPPTTAPPTTLVPAVDPNASAIAATLAPTDVAATAALTATAANGDRDG